MNAKEYCLVVINPRGVEIARKDLDGEIILGNDRNCDIALPGPEIKARHIRFRPTEDGVLASPLDGAAIRRNGGRMAGEAILIPPETLELSGYQLRLIERNLRASGRSVEKMRDYFRYIARLHNDLLQKVELQGMDAGELEKQLQQAAWRKRVVAEMDRLLNQEDEQDAYLVDFIVLDTYYRKLVLSFFKRAGESVPGIASGIELSTNPTFNEFVRDCADEIERRRLEKSGKEPDTLSASDRLNALNEFFEEVYDQYEHRLDNELRNEISHGTIRRDLHAMTFGLGPLEDLRRMPELNEIMVIGCDRIFVEKGNTLEETGRCFANADSLNVVIKRIVDDAGKSISQADPIVDARLKDGSRVHIVIEPISMAGPSITIRRFRETPFSAEELVENGTFTEQARQFLEGCVIARKNIIISGGTNSGKTTLLNTLSRAIPSRERIVIIEDSRELQLGHSNLVPLEARSPNLEGKGAIPIRELVRASLRMRPDRIIVGECRGEEALDMLQAMNTGHDGSLTTAHANSPRELVSRLEVMVQGAQVSLPVRAIHRQIVGALDIVVQIRRLREGQRRITHITEVVEYDQEEGNVVMEDIFRLSPPQELETPESKLVFTGYVPTFIEELEAQAQLSLESLFLLPPEGLLGQEGIQ